MTELERAIAYIEESKRSHVAGVAWLRYHRRDPGHRWAAQTEAAMNGGITFHRKCIREYELVLRVLQRTAKQMKQIRKPKPKPRPRPQPTGP